MPRRPVPAESQGAIAARKPAAIALFLAAMLPGGCVYLPETAIRYDPDCGIYERKVILEAHQVGALMGCRDEGCITALMLAGAVSAGTAVISGSVMVVGNVAYWFEKQGHCLNPARNAGGSGSSPAE